jgi:hypothetical protein
MQRMEVWYCDETYEFRFVWFLASSDPPRRCDRLTIIVMFPATAKNGTVIN